MHAGAEGALCQNGAEGKSQQTETPGDSEGIFSSMSR